MSLLCDMCIHVDMCLDRCVCVCVCIWGGGDVCEGVCVCMGGMCVCVCVHLSLSLIVCRGYQSALLVVKMVPDLSLCACGVWPVHWVLLL